MAGFGPNRRDQTPGFVALTGTPGTGKTAVARRLGGRRPVFEVWELSRQGSKARGRATPVPVDLVRLARSMKRVRPASPAAILVGHLSHLLPVAQIIVLRCHPSELGRRLAARASEVERGTAANLEAEITDVILSEAVRAKCPVWEIDTTGRSVPSVAREVEGILERGSGRPPGSVDWLADPVVTEQLLPRLR